MKPIIQIVLACLLATGCGNDESPDFENIDYRQEMRDFVIHLAVYARNHDGDFLIIPQNGQELVSDNGEGDGEPQVEYLQAFDATGRESMFYGYIDDDDETPTEDKEHLLGLCRMCERNSVDVLTTDYCSTQSKVDNSYQLNEQNEFISFAAPDRDLRLIPDYPTPIFNENSEDIDLVSQARNFLYLINSENYETKQDLISAVSTTNHDLIIIDLYHNENAYTSIEVEQLKIKQNGGRRLVLCYMSIGEAEDYRFYWQENWNTEKPDWLEPENPDWEGNYKVKYWEPEWQNIIYGTDSSYLKRILDSDFDGAYLDIVDAFEYFEER